MGVKRLRVVPADGGTPPNGSKNGTWEGGRTRINKDGTTVYCISKMIDGNKFYRTLGALRHRDALIELAKFESNPVEYMSDVAGENSPIFLTTPLINAYMEYARTGKENSEKWAKTKLRHLEWWRERLVDGNGRPLNLRKLRRGVHVLPHLDGLQGPSPGTWTIEPTKEARHKKEAIKAMFGWLRKHRGEITHAEDPVADMPVGRHKTKNPIKKTASGGDVLKVADFLIQKGGRYGHCLIIQAATGWHTTEIGRFVVGGTIEPVPPHLMQAGVEAILMTPKHKNGKVHYTKVGSRAAFSARVLLGPVSPRDVDGGDSGASISEKRYTDAVKAACDALGLPRFSPAWMRHTNATFAMETSASSPAEIGKFLGHASGDMVSTIYAGKAIPPKVPTVMDDVPLGSVADPERRMRFLQDRLAALEAEVARSK